MRKKKKSGKSKDTEKVKASLKKDPIIHRDDDKGSDYGGLPDRDLKKNLGCG